jgi:Flp pilus assembly protein TadG
MGIDKGKNAEGVSAVEFGIILPLLMTVLMGIIEYGFVFYIDLNLTNAVREGARIGVTKSTADLAQSFAKAATEDYLENAGIEASVDCDGPSQTDPLEVTASISPFEPVVGFLPDFALPDSLTATSAMRWEMADPD